MSVCCAIMAVIQLVSERFDRDLLQRIDAAAKHRGISRSSWIQFTLSRALDQGEG